MWKLRAMIGGLVLATGLALAGIAKADHEKMVNVGDTTESVIFNAGLNVCETLPALKEAIGGDPKVGVCGQTNGYYVADVVLVEDYVVGTQTYKLAQITIKGMVVGQGVAVPMPTKIFFVVWTTLGEEGENA